MADFEAKVDVLSPMITKHLLRHCEKRSDEAIHFLHAPLGSRRRAREDERGIENGVGFI
tara:strand:- start:379 stop:555 length:177 start_codon:yes stop_codon:yes gene_type:complete